MQEIFKAISTYADAYKSLEQIQRRDGSMLPIGDQKTGVIGEFYARLYAASIYPHAELVYGHPSEHAWDIKLRQAGREDHKIQVKTVSAHSSTSRISKIHPGWHELYLLRLDEDFFPVGFWSLHVSDVPWGLSTLACINYASPRAIHLLLASIQRPCGQTGLTSGCITERAGCVSLGSSPLANAASLVTRTAWKVGATSSEDSYYVLVKTRRGYFGAE